MFSKWFCYFKCKGHQFNTVHPTQLPTPVNSVNHGQSGAPQTLFLSVVPHSLRAHFANFFLCPQPKEQNPWHSTTRHQLERLPFLFFIFLFGKPRGNGENFNYRTFHYFCAISPFAPGRCGHLCISINDFAHIFPTFFSENDLFMTFSPLI